MELASYALRVLAPAIFLFALTGVLRGFFQGHGTMVPTAVSQIIEQIINAIVSVAGAYVMLQYGLKLGEKKAMRSLEPHLQQQEVHLERSPASVWHCCL